MESVFRKGSSVERNIDGVWFKASIESIEENTRLYTIIYADDGNIESDVLPNDLRSSVEDPLNGFLSIFSFAKKCTLPKPLAGLIEDDAELRNLQTTTVTIHTSTDTDQAVIINGTAEKIAVGGGLRALRYLKN